MVTKDSKLVDIINENHQASQILMALRIGCGYTNNNEEMTLEEACIERGVNLEHAIRQLSVKSCY